MEADLNFSSRRSPVICLNGCVASSQPLASAAGLDVLKRGGNAADAAVAVAAALAVTEPCSTGLGGDAFCLFFNSDTSEIRMINGSGRSPKGLTLEFLKGRKYCTETPPPVFDALNVTVPGAPACWCDTIRMFGSHKLSFREVLNGAVELGEVGFPVAEITAHGWTHWVAELRNAGKELGGDLLIDGHPPKHGQVFRNPALARTLKELGEHGKAAFYQGRVAQAIIDIIVQHGGVMTLDDLSSHDSDVVSPISTKYKGVRLWESPPNSQGLAALLLLNILENFPLKALGHNSADYIHILVEAIRLAQTDAKSYVGDPDHVTLPLQSLLEKRFSRQRAQLINMDSTFMGFGTGLVPKDCGFSLQNRGASFSLHQNSVNCVAGGKRPYHTIIPALLTDCASESQKPQLLASLGVMGALMQPQGHIQVLFNMLEFGMNPQQALDSPRIFVQYDLKENQWSVNLEEGIDQEVAEVLTRRGHKVNWPVIENCSEYTPGGTHVWSQEVAVWEGTDHHNRGLVESIGQPQGSSNQGVVGRIRSPIRWMCDGILDCFRSLGLALLPLAFCCILANLLLLFPMGEMAYIEQGRLASYIWYFGGLGGGGLLMLVPAVTFITLGKCRCCWNQSLMMCGSVLAAVVGLVGASYCFIVSGLALMQGPLCFTSLGWSYPFADQGGRYLLQSALWSQCLQPLHIVEWNVTLLCVLLGLAVLEFILCFLQLASGVVNAICRPCCYKQEYSLNT